MRSSRGIVTAGLGWVSGHGAPARDGRGRPGALRHMPHMMHMIMDTHDYLKPWHGTARDAILTWVVTAGLGWVSGHGAPARDGRGRPRALRHMSPRGRGGSQGTVASCPTP
jgi:hypothetical protein